VILNAYLSMGAGTCRAGGDMLEQRKAAAPAWPNMQYNANENRICSRAHTVYAADVIDIFPAESEREAVRGLSFSMIGWRVLSFFDPLTGEVMRKVFRASPSYPSSHYVDARRNGCTRQSIRSAMSCATRLLELNAAGGKTSRGAAGPAATHFIRLGDDAWEVG